MGAATTHVRKGKMATPPTVADGKTVWVMAGTGLFKAFDFKGNELWSRNIQQEYGQFGHNWGYGSSPLLYEDSLYVEVLHGMRTKDPSYVLRVDAKTGKTLWRVERPTDQTRESPDAYTTPTPFKAATRAGLVFTGGGSVTA